MNQRQLDWLLGQGIALDSLINPCAVTATNDALHFSDYDTYWNPKTGQFISDEWCLGDPHYRLSTEPIVIRLNPLDWLKNRRCGIVVIRWESLFHMLWDADHIAVPAELRAKYDKYMQPPRLPKVTTL